MLCIIGELGMNIDAIVAAAKGGAVALQQASSEEVQAAQPEAESTQPTIAPVQVAEPAVLNEGRIIASPLAKNWRRKRY